MRGSQANTTFVKRTSSGKRCDHCYGEGTTPFNVGDIVIPRNGSTNLGVVVRIGRTRYGTNDSFSVKVRFAKGESTYGYNMGNVHRVSDQNAAVCITCTSELSKADKSLVKVGDVGRITDSDPKKGSIFVYIKGREIEFDADKCKWVIGVREEVVCPDQLTCPGTTQKFCIPKDTHGVITGSTPQLYCVRWIRPTDGPPEMSFPDRDVHVDRSLVKITDQTYVTEDENRRPVRLKNGVVTSVPVSEHDMVRW